MDARVEKKPAQGGLVVGAISSGTKCVWPSTTTGDRLKLEPIAMSNKPSITELLESMLRVSKELEGGLREGGEAVVRGFEQRQREFDAKKRQLEDDIKRGSKLSKGRIPF